MQDKKILAAVSALVLAGLSGAVHAATFIGADNTAGNYNVAANWDTNAVPTAATPITIGSGKTANANAGQIDRAADTTLDGSLTMAGRFVLNSTGTTATTLTIGATGSYTNTGGDYLVAANAGAAHTLALNGGSFNMTATRGVQLSNGNNTPDAARTGTFNLNSGTFTATIGSAGIAQIYNGFLAGRGTTNSKITVSGGSLTFNMASNGNATAPFFSVGASTSALAVPKGEINVTGGSLSINGGAVYIGDASTGLVVQSDGSVTLSNPLQLARHAGSTGTYTMSGGTLTITSGANPLSVGSGTGAFNFTGGTISLPGDQTGLLATTWFNEAPETVATFDSGLNRTLITVPEPASLALLGGVTLLTMRRRPR